MKPGQEGYGKFDNCCAWMNSQMDTLKDHEDIKHLPITDIINAAQDAFNKLDAMRGTIQTKVIPMKFSLARDEAISLVDDFKPRLRDLFDYRDQLRVTIGRVQAEEDKVATQLKNLNAKFKERIDNLGIAPALRHILAAALVAWSDNVATEGLESCPYPAEWSLQATSPVEELQSAFCMPRAFRRAVEGASDKQFLPHWTAEVRKMYLSIEKDVPAKSAAIMKGVAAKSKLAIGGISCIEIPAEFCWSPFPAKPVFDHHLDSEGLGRAAIHSFQPNYQYIGKANFPWTGMSGILTCLEGLLFVGLLGDDLVQELAGAEMDMWLKSLPANGLAKVPWWVLVPGQAVYWPFGHCPVIFGMQGSQQTSPPLMEDQRLSKRKLPASFSMAGLCSFMFVPNLDRLHSEYDRKLTSCVAANLVASLGSQPPSIAKWNAFTKYKEKFLEIKPVENLDNGNGQGGD